ncbi:MAG: lipopolysaccharide biosynthesis protein [Planctomycetes bacterium]|nr:lipopolysaccharide biosynthesis protein [Planctomycetota bacterium]
MSGTAFDAIIAERPDDATAVEQRPYATVAARRIHAHGLLRPLLSVVDQAIFASTTFLTTVIVGRALSQADLGAYYLAFSLVMLLRGVQVELSSSPCMVFCHRRTGRELATYTGSTLLHHLGLTAVAVACLVATVAISELIAGTAHRASIGWTLTAVLPLLLLREYIRQLAFAHLRLGAAIALDAAIASLQIGGLVLLASTGLLTVAATYGVMGLACGIACCIWLATCRRMFRFDRAACFRDWRHNWRFSRWTLASFLAGSTTPYLLPWMLALAHGEAATGVLTACLTLVGVSQMFVTGVSNFLTPQAARAFTTGGAPSLRLVLWKAAALYAIVLGALCLVFVISGEALVLLAFKSPYAGGGLITAMLSLSVLAHSLGVTAGNGLWAIERPRANFTADLVNLFVTLTAGTSLSFSCGVSGAAAALLLGSVTAAAMRYWMLSRCLQEITSDTV